MSAPHCEAGGKAPVLAASVTSPLRLRVNGCDYQLAFRPGELLLDLLRERLSLTGTKRGCDDSSCGACAVLVNRRPVLSCALFAASCVHDPGENSFEITTIEGLRDDGRLTLLQRKFGELGGAQCGFCTPGMIVSAAALLAHNSRPDAAGIRAALSGNLCRCTGYMQIVAAVRAAIEETRPESEARESSSISASSFLK